MTILNLICWMVLKRMLVNKIERRERIACATVAVVVAMLEVIIKLDEYNFISTSKPLKLHTDTCTHTFVTTTAKESLSC